MNKKKTLNHRVIKLRLSNVVMIYLNNSRKAGWKTHLQLEYCIEKQLSDLF
jgi:hypothetical protein